MSIKTEATVEDLYKVEGKAEIVKGEIILMPPTGFMPSRAGGEIFASLRDYARRTKSGYAMPDNAGFVVHLPHRRSFSPDVAFYTGTLTGGKFMEGAPVFAVEVRSEGDYEPKMERQLAEKRTDYFAAGTLVVWDVDVLRDKVVRVYHANNPENPIVYRRGETAEAEPAVPGWALPVEELFL
jgi:Uma2 family endonuclease